MNTVPLCSQVFQRRARPFARIIATLAILFVFTPCSTAQERHKAPRAHTRPIPATEFSRLIREFSEEGGFFLSDNFISNETSYLHVIGKLHQLNASGGAYIGVGPEQNFTYIAKIRPEIAFIVDIRRQAMIQQLMYKALFEASETRLQFLSRLFSKPMVREGAPGRQTSLPELLLFLDKVPSSEDAFKEYLVGLRRLIEKNFQFPLSERDQSSLEYVYDSFRKADLDIQFRFGVRNTWPAMQYGQFPSMREILLETDLQGALGNFLANEEDYRFVRDLQRHNRVIPIVGDFAGKKALATVGRYLTENKYPVTAFYTSNVEQFLFGDGIFDAFVENVRQLPIIDKSLFIRAFTGLPIRHPARVPGHRLTTVLQKMTVFLEDYQKGLYPDYWSLLVTHFISGKD
jgi:hypothetical protein